MSETTVNVLIIAFFASLAPTIAAVAALKQSKINTTKAEEAVEVAKDAAVKTEQIHVLVNSNLSRVTGELKEAQREIAELHELVATIMKGAEVAKVPDDAQLATGES